ncbi:MAG: sodium:proton antiporter NhaD [Gammaproteobacteria bacterium]|nr:sodium:proton antiporter NhaD [Gammaproteobacteria bacterium]MDJ0870987.1 sodium:proton antiporter NhaD [Gammaproteobacteria bacterium]
MTRRFLLVVPAGVIALLALETFASTSPQPGHGLPGLTDPRAIFCLAVFILSYALVIAEEKTQLRKSKPVMLGAGIIWVVIAWAAPEYGIDHEALREAIYHDLKEYGSLLLFLMAAMTYIAALESVNVFGTLRSRLVGMGLNYRQVFWATGTIAFFLSAVADNLTTSLVMGAVVMAVGADSPRFVAVAMVNIVCAANAGGAFSPFGDITTLMVWQSGHVEFFEFFALFIPAIATYLVPAIIMSFAVPTERPPALEEQVTMLRGAKRAIFLFLLTIVMAVSFEQFLGVPPFMGMMMGLSLLMFHAYYLRRSRREGEPEYQIFRQVQEVEWDTLLFFFGVMFSVGGIGFIGYLSAASSVMYGDWGPTTANIVMGAASAIVDNIPIMFSVLTMKPDMPHFQWLLVTLTCGVGGSLLAVGSAAGVALMGSSKGRYTFGSHLRWTPVIALGYAAGIGTHFLLNS